MRRTIALLITTMLLAAACGDDDAESTSSTSIPATTTTTTTITTSTSSTTTSTSSTTTSSTTTTTEPPSTISPVNGIDVGDASLLERRVIAVKIDNHPRARPQSGLQDADAVIEVLTEGVTRFIALFHHSDSSYLGPVRSVRPLDPTLLAPLGATLAVSGGQDWIKRVVAEAISIVTEGVDGLFRISSRSAPQNLYADTEDLRGAADALGYADTVTGPLLPFGPWEEPPEDTAGRITLDWAPGAWVRWQYVDGRYLRFIGTGSEHQWRDGEGNMGQLSAEVLIVLVGHQTTAGPPAGWAGSAVPLTDTTGSGAMTIFSGGYVLEGTWERDDITEPFRLFDDEGNPVTVPPGTLWISIYPDDQSYRWS